ncbi:MAG: DUF2142 domain-containing protein [Eubacteriales bacterium]|nr:DUF2142 domain-containing protein [Eubacteriales bacterium]
MEKKVKNRWIRLILWLLLSVLLAVGAECLFNYQAYSEGYDAIEISDNYLQKGKNRTYRISFETPTFVNKLYIQGSFSEKTAYTIHATAVNAFDTEEAVKIKDYVYPELQMGATILNRRISSLEIVFPAKKEFSIERIHVSNQRHWNKYRMLFFLLIFFLIIVILMERSMLLKHLELVYLAASLGFGSLIILTAGGYPAGWDETVHYQIVQGLNLEDEIQESDAVRRNYEWPRLKINTEEEQSTYRAFIDHQSQVEQTAIPNLTASWKNYLIYFPMAVFQKAARMMHLSYPREYDAGRFGNLIFCVLLNCLTIRLAKRRKLLIASTAILPTQLFLSSVYSYDGVLWAYLTLGVVLLLNQEEDGEPIRVGQWILANVLIILSCLIKPVYAPVLLLNFTLIGKVLPKEMKARKKVIRIGIVLAVLIVLGVVILLQPTIALLYNGELSMAGDIRAEGTDMGFQLTSVLHHPIAFLKMLVHEVFTLDNLRSLGSKKSSYLASNQMFLNLYTLGTLKNAWSFVLLPFLGSLFLLAPGVMEDGPAKKQTRGLSTAAIILSVMLTWLSMYLAFTSVGAQKIDGVQARYYLPLLLPLSYVVTGRRLKLNMSKERYVQGMLLCCLLLTGMTVYQAMSVHIF